MLFGGKPFEFSLPLGSYIIENVLFKIAYPAALHAQTAVEAAVRLHPQVHARLDEITKVELWTHETCILMIDKRGPLHNFAERDHCLQYMAAVGLIRGTLTAHDYEDEAAADPRIDARRAEAMPLLRAKFEKNVARVFADKAARAIVAACTDKERLAQMPVDEFMDLLVV